MSLQNMLDMATVRLSDTIATLYSAREFADAGSLLRNRIQAEILQLESVEATLKEIYERELHRT